MAISVLKYKCCYITLYVSDDEFVGTFDLLFFINMEKQNCMNQLYYIHIVIYN